MASTWSGTPSIKGQTDSARMALLTISLAGVQLVWGIEMAYCSPYLLSLGLSKSLMSLVWIVGPLSGLITQPVVGVMSDRSRFKWGRRRPFMFVGTLLASLGLLVLGWTTEIVGTFISQGTETARHITIFVAVLALYILDFSINAVQASCRALVVDSLAGEKQQLGNAWASRMIAVGNLAGYFAGTIDLKAIFGDALGSTQFKQLCILSSLALMASIGITSFSVTERVLLERKEGDGEAQGVLAVLKTIFHTMFHLPKRIGDICRIWFYAWIGWFPFMIYNTTFVGEVLQRYDPSYRDNLKSSGDALGDIARVGSMALVGFSCVSLISSIALPWLIASPESTDLECSKKKLGGLKEECQNTLELLRPDLVTAWMISHVMFAIAMFSTLFISTVLCAAFVVGVCGIPWALMTWAPFTIVGEEINSMDNPTVHSGYNSVSGEISEDERYRMAEMGRRSFGSVDRSPVRALSEASCEGGSELSGVYLGIINVFACLPQFVSTFISFIIFSILEPGKSPEFSEGTPPGQTQPENVNAIAVILGIGAVSVLVAAHYTLRFKS